MKNLILVLTLGMGGWVWAEEAKREFQLPDEVRCLRAVSHVRCEATGNANHTQATCSAKVAFKLVNDEISQIDLDAKESNSTSDVNIFTPFRVIAYIGTLSSSEDLIASTSGKTSINKAQSNLQDRLRTLREQLALRNIPDCTDFKDDSKEKPFIENKATGTD
ncbi:hypothetical protein K2X30_06680 [bacterium]|jgi:hypothetical protein|nr:hypothetical protein [bacterium]